MRIIIAMMFFLSANIASATHYQTLGTCDTNYSKITLASMSVPDTRYPELEILTNPIVKVYVDGAKQFEHISKFASCVPHIDFSVSLKSPEWIQSFPTYVWTGDDGESYYADGSLIEFTKRFTNRNPSFSERVKFDYIEAKDLGYPLRSGHWSVGSNWNPNAEQVKYHLMYHANHRGKFSRAWLDTQSLEMLLSMHDDDHEGRLQRQFVNRKTKSKIVAITEDEMTLPEKKTPYHPTTVPAKKVYNIYKTKRTRRVYRARSGCPSGNCPTY